MKVTLELSTETLALLAVLDDHGRADAALRQVLARAVNGISRSHSWEREWLCYAFGADWLERLEADPRGFGRQRPRRR